jgi:hypothetical protein
MEIVLALLRVCAICLLYVCLLVVVLKIVWNLCLPYALVRRGPDKGGVSAFPLIEFVPLLIGVVSLYFFPGVGILTPGRLLVYGICAIVISYLHLFAVLFISRFIMFGLGKGPKCNDPNKGPGKGKASGTYSEGN